MSALILRLLFLLNNSEAEATNHHIAQVLLEHFYELENLSISEVAKLAAVSKSTISKFTRSLGYADYAELRYEATFKENRYGFSLNYNQNIAEWIEKYGMKSYLDNIQADIDLLQETLDIPRIQELAKALHHYPKVIAIGAVFSELGAMDLQMKLVYNGKFIYTQLSDVKQKNVLKTVDKDTLVIVYSNSGSFIEHEQMSEFHEKKDFTKLIGKLVLITSNQAMENHPAVDLCVTYGHTSSVQSHSILYPLINDYIIQSYRELRRG